MIAPSEQTQLRDGCRTRRGLHQGPGNESRDHLLATRQFARFKAPNLVCRSLREFHEGHAATALKCARLSRANAMRLAQTTPVAFGPGGAETHVGRPSTAIFLKQLFAWVDDQASLDRILVSNPTRLYWGAEA